MTKFPQFEPVPASKYPIPESLNVECGYLTVPESQNTPSYWGKLVGETLANSHYIEFPGVGHGVINNGVCALSVIKAFFDSPTNQPDDRCAKALPGPIFVTPETD